MVIREDIINKALNESINEFMIEEGLWNNIKNGVAMYMDNATNGQWNNKYNIHAKGSGATVAAHYFKQWLQYHYNRLQDLIYGKYYGNRSYYTLTDENDKRILIRAKHDWSNNSYNFNIMDGKVSFIMTIDRYGRMLIKDSSFPNAKPISPTIEQDGDGFTFEGRNAWNYNTTYRIHKNEDNTTPEQYVREYCNAQNFSQYTKNTVENGDALYKIYNYINEIQKINDINSGDVQDGNRVNYDELLKKFDINNFYMEYGKLDTNRAANQDAQGQAAMQQQGQPQQQQSQAAMQQQGQPQQQQPPQQDIGNTTTTQATPNWYGSATGGQVNYDGANTTTQATPNWYQTNTGQKNQKSSKRDKRKVRRRIKKWKA